MWLWSKPVATALIQPLAWEPPYAVGGAQRNSKKTKKIIIIIIIIIIYYFFVSLIRYCNVD